MTQHSTLTILFSVVTLSICKILILTTVPFVLRVGTVDPPVAHLLRSDAPQISAVDHAVPAVIAVQFVRLVFAVDVSVANPLLRDAPLLRVTLESVVAH